MDDERRELGDLETTHIDELMPETTVNVTELENDLINAKLEIEMYKKEVEKFKIELADAEAKAEKAQSIGESFSQQLADKDGEIATLKDTLDKRTSKVGLLNDTLSEKESKILELSKALDAMAGDLANLEKLAADNLITLTKTKSHYNDRPAMPNNWKAGLANWLVGGAIEGRREWFIKLHDILKD